MFIFIVAFYAGIEANCNKELVIQPDASICTVPRLYLELSFNPAL